MQWRLSFKELSHLIDRARDSASGPDGIPYAAWRFAHTEMKSILHAAYLTWLDTGNLPHGFNLAYLWLLPKSDDERDASGCLQRDPADTRPLSGSNTDNK